MIIEEIEKDEAALQEDLYSADAKFAEYYNVSVGNHIVSFSIKLDLFLYSHHTFF